MYVVKLNKKNRLKINTEKGDEIRIELHKDEAFATRIAIDTNKQTKIIIEKKNESSVP